MKIFIIVTSAIVVALAVAFGGFLFLIGGPKYLRNFIVHETVIRTLEVTAQISYQGKPVRLTLQTECVSPGDYMAAVSLEASPQVAAASLPDGSVIAFREMKHLCSLVEGAITQELGKASGPRILRRETPVPALPAIWFSDSRDPRVVEEYLSPEVNTPRYRPIAFSMREVPIEPGHKPLTARKKILPAWSDFADGSLRLCSVVIERLPQEMLSTAARADLAAGRFQPQELRSSHFKPDTSFFSGPQQYFTIPGEVEITPELRRMFDEAAARRSRILTPVPENGTWVARPLQAIRYYGEPRGLPDEVRVDDADLKLHNRWIAPLPNRAEAVAFQATCFPRP